MAEDRGRHADISNNQPPEAVCSTETNARVPSKPSQPRLPPQTAAMGPETLWSLLWDSGVATISLAAFLFSLGTLAVRFLEAGPNAVPAFEVACLPSAICWVACSALLCKSHTPILARSKTVRLLTILRGLSGAAALTLYYLSIEMLPLKDAVTLFFCSPVIAVLMEWMVVGDNPSSSSLAGILFTVAGVVLVTQPNCWNGMLSSRVGMSLGMLCALLAASCNAVAFVIVRSLGTRQSVITLTWWYHLVVMGVTAIPLATKYPVAPVLPTPAQSLLLAAVVACQFCGQILLNRGFSLVSATRGSAINVLQVLFSYVWELTVLKEDMNFVSLLGGLCVMAGVITVALAGGTGPQSRSPSQDGTGSPSDPEVTYLYIPVTETADGEPVRKLVHVHSHDAEQPPTPTYTSGRTPRDMLASAHSSTEDVQQPLLSLGAAGQGLSHHSQSSHTGARTRPLNHDGAAKHSFDLSTGRAG